MNQYLIEESQSEEWLMKKSHRLVDVVVAGSATVLDSY